MSTTAVQTDLERARRRVLTSGFMGSTVEFYDFILYATASAVVFNRLFFTNLDPALGTIASFATLAIGYLARPVGGVLFGHFGDRFGRKRMLIISLVVMGVASTLIGVLPTQTMVGALAPILLIVLRIVQGLSMAGEWGGATIMAMEHADERKRATASSVISAGAPMGSLLASGVLALFSMLPADQFLTWGWRVPFLLSAVMVAIALWIRTRVNESPLFLQAQAKAHDAASATPARPVRPARAVLKQWRSLVLTIVAGFGPHAHRTLMTAFLISVGIAGGVSRAEVLWVSAASGVLNILLMVPVGRLVDRIGRKRVMYAGLAAALVTAWPTFVLAASGNVWFVLIAFFVAGACGTSVLLPTLGTLIIEQFPTRTRYTGASVGYQIAASIGGGLAPVVAAAIMTTTDGDFLPLSLVVMATLALSWVAVVFLKERSRHSIAE
ncbi:MFS family permease [Cryobacterium mesophilum]|uniref:MFS transporter n=1 Tax=Terrimesophilobacter mesophilus TaxID=433647 RepID=A0A4R8VBK8_9MICO|nr:MFS transporter [Terrimesophilobacter mesophilus]MBB5632390.1 MFS family permease [Terrimesophilobacter mesophilus]TFB79227.1 MFS transporter [Terrimesophilobacter mesophilus]